MIDIQCTFTRLSSWFYEQHKLHRAQCQILKPEIELARARLPLLEGTCKTRAGNMHILIIDNYDSFTYNLMHLIGRLGPDVEVVRNDALSAQDVLARDPDAIILSPGPCTPNEAGICLDVVKEVTPTIPTLGVCLGHQTIGQAFGGHVIRAPIPLHGKISPIVHENSGIFAGLPKSFAGTRYHSLIVERETLPPELNVTAQTKDGIIMGLHHRSIPAHGVQFHPESIASECGSKLIENFLLIANAWNASRKRLANRP
jgi:anthranilate synthase component II